MPFIVLKYDVLFFQASTPVPDNPDLAWARLGPVCSVTEPDVNVALVKE
jgi:hypothetical protein